MSTLSSGRVYWAAAGMALLCLVNQVHANEAILTSVTPEGYHDVCLNITTLELWPGLDSWDDLAFTSLHQPSFSEYTGSGMETSDWEKLAVIDLASGTLCQYTDGCMDDIASHYQQLCDLEHPQQNVEKRFRYIADWINRGWHLSKNHAVSITALSALSAVVGGSTEAILKLSRSAICAKEDGKQACLSWAGGAQAIKRGIALNIIASSQGTFGGDAVSGEEYEAVVDGTARRKWKRKITHDVCVSNRPKGCT